MNIEELKNFNVPDFVIEYFKKKNILRLNPAQIKSIKKGVLDDKNMLICTPTGSGKTAIATFAITKALNANPGSKAVYLVPLKALANEKFKEYTELFQDSNFKVGISTGDFDSSIQYLDRYDLLLLTVEKMDSILRHHCQWLPQVKIIIIDEIHLLNDAERGPTLEIIITMMKMLLKKVHIIGLSATIGNPKELAEWLNAELVEDDWRPVKLEKGIYHDGKVEMYE